MDVKLKMEKELEQLQWEMNELQELAERLPQDINLLEEKLVEKDQQLSDAIKKRQRRSIAYTDAMNQLSVTEAALEQSRQKFDTLQLDLQKKLEEQDTVLQKQLEQERMQRQQGEQQESFRKQLRELSELWRARTRQSAKKRRELEEKIQRKMEDNKDKEASKQKQLNNKRETQKIRKSSSGLCRNGRSGDGQ